MVSEGKATCEQLRCLCCRRSFWR